MLARAEKAIDDSEWSLAARRRVRLQSDDRETLGVAGVVDVPLHVGSRKRPENSEARLSDAQEPALACSPAGAAAGSVRRKAVEV
jgi:hypothetical protein